MTLEVSAASKDPIRSLWDNHVAERYGKAMPAPVNNSSPFEKQLLAS